MDYAEVSGHVSLGRIVGLFRPYLRPLLGVSGLILLSASLGLATPFLLRTVIDEALSAGDLSWLVWLTGALTTVACLSAVAGILQVQLSTQIGQSIMHDLRVRVYAHLQSLPGILQSQPRRRNPGAHCS